MWQEKGEIGTTRDNNYRGFLGSSNQDKTPTLKSLMYTEKKTVLFSQLNWLRCEESELDNASVVEYPLYSDASFTGNFPEGFGPYGFLNTIPLPEGPGIINAPIILRVAIHLPDYRPDMSKKNESLYHGGFWVDEIAAPVSVALGVRIEAGGMSREFKPGQDPYGQPWEWHYESKPVVRVRSRAC